MCVCVWEKEDVRGDDVGREVKSGKAKRAGRLWLGARAPMACGTRQCRVGWFARSGVEWSGRKRIGDIQK